MAFGNLAQVLKGLGRKDDDYYDDEDEEYLDDEVVEEKPVKKAKGFGKISPFSSKKVEEIAHEREVFAILPESIDNAHEITDKILEGYTVVLNTERCDEALARRIFELLLWPHFIFSFQHSCRYIHHYTRKHQHFRCFPGEFHSLIFSFKCE